MLCAAVNLCPYFFLLVLNADDMRSTAIAIDNATYQSLPLVLNRKRPGNPCGWRERGPWQ